ncbi:MAG: hypothetical protein ACM3SR_06720 [Ignavibacteriales bacterium]|jgi:hypothetical protein
MDEIKELIEQLSQTLAVLSGNAAILKHQYAPVKKAVQDESLESVKHALIGFEMYLSNVKEKIVDAYLLWEKIMEEIDTNKNKTLSS